MCKKWLIIFSHNIQDRHAAENRPKNIQVCQQDAYPQYAGCAVKTNCNTLLPFQGKHLSCWLYASIYSKLLKLMGASNAGGVWKIHDSWRISGRSLLDRHMWSIFGWSGTGYSKRASSVSCYKQMPPSHPSVNPVCGRWHWKNTKKCNIFFLIMDSHRGLLPRALHF